MRTVYIVIGCDTDPDRVGFIDGVPTDTLTWRGMLEGIPRLKETVTGLRDDAGHAPVFTWLLRVDEQVRRIHGDYAWVLKNHTAFLEELESSGDELGWHPHFWRFDQVDSRWHQDAKDVAWQIDMLTQAHASYSEVFPGRAKSVRMGWDFHNNDTLRTLDSLGVVVDFSAIPGLSTLTSPDSKHPENLFDWYITPQSIYKPSRADYRRPAAGSEQTLSLVEAPNTVSRSRFWGLIGAMQFARKMKDFGHISRWLRKPTYWINITGKPKLFSPVLGVLRSELRRSDDAPVFFVSYFHPDELLENNSSLYDLASTRNNLKSILELCKTMHVPARFIRARDIPNVIA